jgi:hypothetical protein
LGLLGAEGLLWAVAVLRFARRETMPGQRAEQAERAFGRPRAKGLVFPEVVV